ncbi:hypothetical protein SKAU_G00244340 [Synaphobranchus kaupii]|uniref:Tesmin/TSO1-like CXC domain-containing protein n=1 Tax=Synaphobranchus kaupii TaxID=118154 RepID=A0A9Q1F1K6_SYNKA|nr:hypothetical protein SKAU_G00244340 [Synaphobranchus kaupii]
MKLEAGKLCLAGKSSIVIEHYTGPKKMTPPALKEVPRTDAIQDAIKQSVSRAQKKDAAWLCQLHSSPLALDWSAYNVGQDSAPKLKTISVFGPLLDSPPAHPDTVLSTIAYLDTLLRWLGMSHSHITFDMQLYMIAYLIQWSDAQRWSSVVLRPGMMHTLMSFIGSIGELMNSTGVEELVGASFGGLTSIFNGKAWPKAMPAFRMVMSALFHDFLEEGEKTHKQITAWREHPTGRLWVDCVITPTIIAHKFWRAEKEGDWLLQQHCLEEMRRYFFAAGHHHYSRWITWHLRDMQHLPATAKDDLLAGSHVCRHSDGAAAVAVWIQFFDICSHLSMSLDEIYDNAEALDKTMKPNRHKEEVKGWRELDAEDRAKILRVLWENSHPLTTETTTLQHIINSQVADRKVNVQDALKIRQDMSTLFSSSLPRGFHAAISKKVVTMKFKTKGVKVNGKIICDLEALFSQLLVVGSKRRMELSALFYYELGPVPASIIDEYGCLRKGNKSVIVQRLGILVPNPHPPDVVLIDASQLIYHVVWPWSSTVADLSASMGHRLNRYIATFVIFDRYQQVSAKDHERQRRAGESSKEYQLPLTTPLLSHDKVMKNKTNKRRLGELLCTHSIGDHIEMVSRADSIVTHDEADVSLISYMLDAARQLSTFSATTLMCLCSWSIGARRKGKVSALKAMRVVPGDLLHFIGEEGATDLQITEAVRGFFLALYNQRESASLNIARYDIYQKRKTSPALKTLPPTEHNVHLHGRRAHLQVLLWKAADHPDPPDVDITKFGWDKKEGEKEGEEVIMPVLDASPVAPPALLDIISCSCKAGLKPCTTANSSCASAGLACTSYCFCKSYDSTCCNPLTHSQQEEQDDKNVESGEEDEDRADDEDEVDDKDMVYNSEE